MKIAIASGKGGTGKTTIATNLAFTIAQQGQTVQLLDCDVEEPNCHIFVKPEFETKTPATIPTPSVDEEKCTGCGTCADICQYSAITCIKGKVLVFPEMCHGCGGCEKYCPAKAITEQDRPVGQVESGRAKNFRFTQGLLNIGQVMAPTVINAVKKAADNCEITIIDAPPGTSCPVIEAVRDTNFIILATEPTPFGLNDLKLAVDMARALTVPFAVAINRADIGDKAVKEYCDQENIEVILEIPNDRKIAEAYSRGELATESIPKYVADFTQLAQKLTDRIAESMAK